MSSSNELGQWYNSIPRITRAWFTGSIVVPVTVLLGIFYSGQLTLSFTLIIKHFQVWRLLTAVLLCNLSTQPDRFAYLIHLYFLYTFSSRLETSTFQGRPADYVFCLIFLGVCSIILGFIIPMDLLMLTVVNSVLYIWCQLNKEVIMSFWFGMQVKAMYLPWVYLVFDWIVGVSVIDIFCGIIIGHLYYFLIYKYPRDFGGRQLLYTPRFLYRYFPNERMNFGTGPTYRYEREGTDDPPNRNPQAFHGRGNVLGGR